MERPAPAIIDRDFVDTALNTGLMVIDAMVPLGRGQRELIIGDRETGKTAIAIDTIINQRETNVICVCCAVGQKTSSISQVIDAVQRYGAPQHAFLSSHQQTTLPVFSGWRHMQRARWRNISRSEAATRY